MCNFRCNVTKKRRSVVRITELPVSIFILTDCIERIPKIYLI